VTCQVENCADGAYDVSVVPHWNVTEAVVEREHTSTRALCRHAEIALQLREAGWSLTERVAA